MKTLILGVGLQGSVLAEEMTKRDRVSEVIIGDRDIQRLRSQEKLMRGRVETALVDVRDRGELVKLMEGVDVVINGTDWKHNHIVTEAAVEACVNLIDMGTIFDDVLERQLKLDEAAEDAGLTIIPCCGLSPGITNLLALHGAEKLDRVEEVHIRCGGIPQNPKPPLGYKTVWSLEGVIDEYTERVKTIRNGKTEYVNPLTGLETIEFANSKRVYECFYTQGLSTLPDTVRGAREMDYKTVRHIGHCEKIRTLVELGFTSSGPVNVDGYEVKPRNLLIKLLQPILDLGCDRDMVVLRVSVSGERNGKRTRLVFEMLDLFDEADGVTAMSRTTVYPCSIVAEMMMRGDVREKGVLPPEKAIPIEPFMAELAKRNIHIEEKTEQLN